MTASSWVPSRKVLAGIVAGAIGFALTKLAISLDPITEQALNVLVMGVVSYFVPNATQAVSVPADDPQLDDPNFGTPRSSHVDLGDA